MILDEYTTHIEAMKVDHYQVLFRGTAAILIGVGTIRVRDDSTLVQWCAVVGNCLDDHPEDWTLPDAFIVDESDGGHLALWSIGDVIAGATCTRLGWPTASRRGR